MITLINPPGIKTFSGLQMHTPNPPLGLAYIAAAVRDAGFEYRVIDATGAALDAVSPYPDRPDFMVQGLTFDEIVGRIHPDSRVIGMTCMFSTLWPLTNRVAHAIRESFPDALLVLGGEHGTAVPEHVLGTSPFDVVVLGEGEETFVELLRAHEQGRPLSRREGHRVPSGRAAGDQRAVGAEAGRGRHPVARLGRVSRSPSTSTGTRRTASTSGVRCRSSAPADCPFQCTFCSNPGMWTQRWIARDPVALADEMELYVRKYRVTNFDFQDLTAIVKRQWIVDFCRELIARDLKITWQMPSGTRAEVFDAEVADLLYRSGCRALAFAPESGSPEILKIVRKQVDLGAHAGRDGRRREARAETVLLHRHRVS